MIRPEDIQDKRDTIWCAPPKDGDSVFLWRMKCRWWACVHWVGNLGPNLRGLVKQVFYRKRIVHVDFDPATGVLKTSEPLPPGAALRITYIVDSSSGEETIQLAKVTQWELRAIPAFFRGLWKRIFNRDGGLRVTGYISGGRDG